MLVVFLTGLIGYSSYIYWDLKNQQERLEKLSQSMGLVLSQDFAKLVLLNEVSVASDITAKLKSFPLLHSMVLYNKSGVAVYQYHHENHTFEPFKLPPLDKRLPMQDDNELKLYLSADYQGMNFGDLIFNFHVQTVWQLLLHDSFVIFFIAMTMIIISYLLAGIFTNKFTTPIIRLVTFLEKVELSDFTNQQIQTNENNEFSILYDEINTMLNKIDTAQKAQRLSVVAFETQSGMMVTDSKQNILQVNKAFTKITGYEPNEVIGFSPSFLKSGKHDKSFYESMWLILKENNFWTGEIYNRHKNGHIYPEQLTIQVVLDDYNEIMYYVASFVDLSLQRDTEARVEFLTQYDSLTELANRDLLVSKIQQHLDSSTKKGFGAVMCFDFHNFKMVNDAHGLQAGDIVLQEVAFRLKSEFHNSDLTARIGSDEFAVWFSFLDTDKDMATLQAQTLAEKLYELLILPYEIDGQIIHCIACVGISIYNQTNNDASILLRQSDAALHFAKQNRDKNISFFDAQAELLAKKHLDLYTQLLYAIKNDEFRLLYQPQYDNENKLCGVEALIRWHHSLRGVVSPLDFIPVAEQTGLIVPIGLWVLQTASQQLSLWQSDANTAHLAMAVNISARQFNQDNFVEQVKLVIAENNIPKDKLKLELTESILVNDIDKVKDKMLALREIGVQISLDDFGTGYSSLQYLRNLPLNQIKIDQSFIKNMIENENDIAIIKSILSLGEAFNMEVIAEGVETKEHFEFLTELGCKMFQGYYFGKPQNATDLN